jgi:aryl-alcohol dehydrogenase-like predicted oxidoreductase
MPEQKNQLTRREFVQRSAVGMAAISAAGLSASCSQAKEKDKLPKRELGKTGLQVSMLAFGSGSQFLKNEDGSWEPMLEKAIELGINLFDTASSYKWGAAMSSEQRLGKILPAYRDKIYLSTKFDAREPEGARAEFETSLKHLQTDYVDILLIHSIEPSEDLAAIENGVYREMLSLKEQKMARFIGFSSMNSSKKSRELIEKLDLDVTILAMNPTQYGDFANIALPVARENKMGVMAMKVMRDIVGKEASPAELIRYALSQEGVTTACIGHFGMETLEENVRLVKEFAMTDKTELDNNELETRLTHLAGPHALSWARPDYRDGQYA